MQLQKIPHSLSRAGAGTGLNQKQQGTIRMRNSMGSKGEREDRVFCQCLDERSKGGLTAFLKKQSAECL